MIVVDTNIIAYLYLPGDHTVDAERVLAKDPEWATPLLWRSELRNVLAGYLRQRRLSLATAIRIMEEGEALMRGREFTVVSTDVLQVVSGCRRSAYDLEFLVLARDLGVKLVTTDRRLQQGFPEETFSMKEFLAA